MKRFGYLNLDSVLANIQYWKNMLRIFLVNTLDNQQKGKNICLSTSKYLSISVILNSVLDCKYSGLEKYVQNSCKFSG